MIERMLYSLFGFTLSFLSSTQISGELQQFSLGLDRRLRHFITILLGKILLRRSVITLGGLKYILPDARLESLYILLPMCEKNVWRYLRPSKGQTFIDVGAHVGKYSFQVAQMVGPNGLVLALEPYDKNYEALMQGIRLNNLQNVTALKVAAWNEQCKLRLFLGEASTYHSAKVNVGLGYVIVDAQTVDSIISKLDPKQVDWIKVDVEGSEVEVFEGLKKTLVTHAPRLAMEVRMKNLHHILEIAKALNYSVKPVEGEQHQKSKVGYFYFEPSPVHLGEFSRSKDRHRSIEDLMSLTETVSQKTSLVRR